MRGPIRLTAIGALVLVAPFAAACGSVGGGGDDSSSSGSGGSVTVHGCQPQNPLVPGNTGESCGHDVVNLFTSTLFRYDPKTAEPKPDLAESVTTNDNQHFTVKIKDAKFQDGTPVTAKSFVDAWNFTAAQKNAQYLSYFFEPIQGFTDTQCVPPANVELGEDEDPCKKYPAKSDTMSGLKVVDDHTFTITTTDKVSNLPVRLGYDAFAPLPEAFFKDQAAFEKKPIGAGPYQVVSYTPKQSVVLKRWDGYGGEGPKGGVDQITFKIYTDEEAAYNDVIAGNLDVIDDVPLSALIGQKYKDDLPDRWAQSPYPAIQTVAFPSPKSNPNPGYTNPKIREAISMAIDRDKIIKDQFDGARVPADSWGAPGLVGYNPGTCGDVCKYDPTKAKQLLKDAGGFNGTLAIAYNADSDHKPWVTATCNSINSTLGIKCVAQPVPTFDEFRDKIGERSLNTMFRSGWVLDYPHIEDFLAPLYGTNAASNDNDYSNPAFDKTLKEAAAATGDESLALYKKAEEMLVKDLPTIPLWYYTATIGWSDKMGDVAIDISNGRPDYLDMTTK